MPAFGEVITPGGIEIGYPALLDAPAPILHAYSPETVVAGRTEAIVSLGAANSRMKDFHDLRSTAQKFTLKFANLTDAIMQTFERRKSSLPEMCPLGSAMVLPLRETTSGRLTSRVTGSK